MSDIDTFAYLWDGSQPGWVLLHLYPSEPDPNLQYGIYNEATREALLIDEDTLYVRVVAMMRARGVKVVREVV